MRVNVITAMLSLKNLSLTLVLTLSGASFNLAFGATRYVWAGSPSPDASYTNWNSAARTIQDAVDAAQTGDIVLVTNGSYSTGGRAVYGTMTNRIAIDKAITVQSVNGPGVTWIVGAGIGPGGTDNGDGAIRCVYVGTNAVLSGFTLTNGHTRTSGDYDKEQSGGGAWCEVSGVLTNCTLSGNSTYYSGGGSYDGTLNNCTLSGNSASSSGGGLRYGMLNNYTLSAGSNSPSYGGGSRYGTLNNCTLSDNSASYGGGSSYGTLNNCILSGNSATGLGSGGGSSYGTLNNCTLIGNSAGFFGGGSSSGALNNCTLSGNSAAYGGGSSSGTLINCIVYYNTAVNGSNYNGCIFSYSCVTPLPSGTGNITNEPAFVDRLAGNFRLLATSPCINAGNDSVVQPGWLDMDGHPRIFGPHVDMGAYEFVDNTNRPVFIGWSMSGSNFSAQVTTEAGRAYWLESRDSLSMGAWQVVCGLTNVAGFNRLTDTNAASVQRFYRLGSAPLP